MADAMWDLIYLDWDRVRAAAVEMGAGAALMAEQGNGVDKDAGRSRSLQTAVFRTVREALAAGEKIVHVDGGFDFAKWAPQMFRDGQIVQISTGVPAGGELPDTAAAAGMIRLLDYPWLSSVMETLPRMLKVSQRAELSGLKQKREAHQITQAEVEQKVKEHQSQLKDLENWKMEELTDVIRELFGHSVRLKIVPAGATRGEMFVAACPPTHFLEPPALLSQRYGCDIDAPWQVLGLVNIATGTGTPAQPMPTGNAVEDMFERLALAVNRIHRVASAPDFPAFSLTPLAVWREI